MKYTCIKLHILSHFKVCIKVQLLISAFAICFSANASNYYWVGGSGDWSDFANHWASTSGGNTFYTQEPDTADNVFFDSNSFLQPNDSVVATFIFCHNLISTVPSGNHNLVNGFPSIYGSLILNQHLKLKADLIYLYGSSTSNILDLTGNIGKLFSFSFRGNGVFDLKSDLEVGELFFEANSKFNSNGYTIKAYHFLCHGSMSSNSNIPIIDLDTSKLFLQEWNANTTANSDVILDADSARFIKTGNFSGGKHHTYFNLDSVYFGFTGFNAKITDSCVFNNVTNAWGRIGTGNKFNNLITTNANPSTFDIQGRIIANKIEINDTTIANALGTSLGLGGGTIDSLIVNIPGVLLRNGYLQPYGDTLYITKYLKIKTDSTITNQGSYAGIIGDHPVYVSAPSVCLDYVKLFGITSTIPGAFYAGTHSLNWSNSNTNILFSACQETQNIWPGDANSDLVANNFDLLSVGLAYADTGSVRVGASLAWVGQTAVDWTNSLFGVNNKHVDCNGDGVINSDDTLAILLNYGQTHLREVPQLSNINDPELYIQLALDTASVGDTLHFLVGLGTAIHPADSVYGVAFTINYESAVVDSGSVVMHYDSCWMGIPNLDLINLQRDNYTNGKIDCALTGIDHLNRSGYGQIGILSVDMKDDLSGRDSIFKTLHLNYSNVRILDKDGNSRQVNIVNDSIVIGQDVTGIHHLQLLENKIVLAPNPAQENVLIDFTRMNGIVNKISVYNALGEEVFAQKIDTELKIQIQTQKFQTGIYSVKIQSSKGIVIKKLCVIE